MPTVITGTVDPQAPIPPRGQNITGADRQEAMHSQDGIGWFRVDATGEVKTGSNRPDIAQLARKGWTWLGNAEYGRETDPGGTWEKPLRNLAARAGDHELQQFLTNAADLCVANMAQGVIDNAEKTVRRATAKQRELADIVAAAVAAARGDTTDEIDGLKAQLAEAQAALEDAAKSTRKR